MIFCLSASCSSLATYYLSTSYRCRNKSLCLMLPVLDHFIFKVDPNNTYIKIKISINLNAVFFIALQCYLVNRNSFQVAGYLIYVLYLNMSTFQRLIYVSTSVNCVTSCCQNRMYDTDPVGVSYFRVAYIKTFEEQEGVDRYTQMIKERSHYCSLDALR